MHDKPYYWSVRTARRRRALRERSTAALAVSHTCIRIGAVHGGPVGVAFARRGRRNPGGPCGTGRRPGGQLETDGDPQDHVRYAVVDRQRHQLRGGSAEHGRGRAPRADAAAADRQSHLSKQVAGIPPARIRSLGRRSRRVPLNAREPRAARPPALSARRLRHALPAPPRGTPSSRSTPSVSPRPGRTCLAPLPHRRTETLDCIGLAGLLRCRPSSGGMRGHPSYIVPQFTRQEA